jgi:hypothetical protein
VAAHRAGGCGACRCRYRSGLPSLVGGNYVEQGVTESDGTRYVITFQRPDGSSADELRAAAELALGKLTTAVGRLADRLDVRARDSRILSVRAGLREVARSLRDLVASHPA